MKDSVLTTFFALVLGVTIVVREAERVVICAPEPKMEQFEDGSYARLHDPYAELTTCVVPARKWREIWTDFPENGGKFLRKRGN